MHIQKRNVLKGRSTHGFKGSSRIYQSFQPAKTRGPHGADSGSKVPPTDRSCQAGGRCVASRMGPGACSSVGQTHSLQGVQKNDEQPLGLHETVHYALPNSHERDEKRAMFWLGTASASLKTVERSPIVSAHPTSLSARLARRCLPQ